MKCGIIGLPNAGKSTFFNLISNSKAISAHFPFSTIEPNHGLINIPDQRLFKLKNIVNPLKTIPSQIKIVDIAGLIKGSHKGDGLGNKFLSHVRETNVLIHIIRFFYNPEILHVEGKMNPIRDKEIIDIELQLKDLETIEKKIQKNSKTHSSNIPIKNQNKNHKILNNVLSFLKKGKNIRTYPFSIDEKKFLEKLQLLTMKPILYVCNTSKKINQVDQLQIEKLKKIIKMEHSFLIDLSLKDSNIFFKIEKIIQHAKKLLRIQNFFTVGKKEVRSWNIPNPCTAYEAASVIHSDFKKGFIKAEIIHFNDFIQYKSYEKIKKLGKIFIAGKNSILQDGDIIHFRLNRRKIL